MRILHTIGSLSRTAGGPSRSSQGLVAGLGAVGIETWLLSFQVGDTVWVEGVSNFRSASSSGVWGKWRAVESAIQEIRPELMHIHGIWGPYAHLSCLVARRYDIPYIVAPRGMLEPWSLNAKKWKKRLAMWMYQRRDLKHAVALHATAESEAEQFRKLGFRQPIIVSPNGVDLPETMPARTVREDGKRTILFLSRIHPKKGLMELVEAWAKIKGSSLVHCCDSALVADDWEMGDGGRGTKQWQSAVAVGSNCGTGDRGRETKQRQSAAAVGSNQGPRKQTNTLMNSRTNELLDWHVEYAGPDYGGHLHAVQKRIKELGVEDDFTYLGDIGDEEKWNAYRRADVFVLPTYSENFGIVVAEALAAGVPVLTTTGTPWKVLVENQCGWWIEPGVKSLGKVLPEILQMNRETLAEMGNRGRVYAIRAFSWQSIADKMRQAYAWFLEGGNPPPCVRL